jgi:RNA polymerase sigma factor (sigma-70 family)
MPRGQLESVLHLLRRATPPYPNPEPTDNQLLERYVAHRDAEAFATIVRRHGGHVWSVCRHVLGHYQDADDAFQATFLVLVSRAATIRKTAALASWLHGVAYRTAQSARRARKDQGSPGEEPEAKVADQPVTAAALREVQAILDEEVGRLPERYRAPFVLCCLAGKSRAEAARELGWKEGTVSSRLAHARTALRQRLTRRGIALTTALTAVELTRNAGRAAPEMMNRTVSAALAFAAGRTDATHAVSARAAALVTQVLRTMNMTRLKIAGLFVLTLSVLSLGVGLGVHASSLKAPDPAGLGHEAAAEQPTPQAEAAPDPVPPKDPEKPLRVLLFAGAPTREYQFVRSLFVNQSEKKQAELSICLQAGARAGIVQDVPPERMLKSFPTRLVADEKKDDNRYTNLAEYDVILAFDPDWTQLTEEQGKLLEQWIGKDGHGLVLVAGPINTNALARPAAAPKFKPILDVLPVRLEDGRLLKERDSSQPWSLAFPAAEPFLKLDAAGKEPLAGWSDFFFGKQRDDWQKTDDRPERGFYSAYPVKSIKAGATVLATFRDPAARIAADNGKPKDLPYLVAMRYGKGRTVYLGSGETWRLRQFNTNFYERFWSQLPRFAASFGVAAPGAAVPRAPAVTPEQRKTAEKGLAWLAANQQRDGHWDGAEGTSPVTATALAGTALVMQGSTMREGEYAEPLRKTIDWLMQRSQPDGAIGNVKVPAEADRNLDGHGHGLIFLSSVYGDEEDRERRTKLQDILTRAVQYTVKAQTSGGGWGHFVRGRDKAGDDKADIESTVLQLQALRAARSAGIEVPKEALDKGWKYLEKTIDPSGTEAISSLAGALGAGEYGSPAVKKWLQLAVKSMPPLDPKGKRRAEDDRKLYSFARLAYLLGEEGHAKLLPETKASDRITWGEWRKKAFDYLAKTQNADGSWENESGKVHATALALAILQLDYGVLPIQR